MKIKAFFAGLLAIVMLFGVVSCAKTPVGDADDTQPRDTVAARPVETAVANEDGEITGSGYRNDVVYDAAGADESLKDASRDLADALMSVPEGSIACSTEAAADMFFEAPAEAEGSYKSSSMWGAPDVIIDDNQIVYNAGTLTAGEWHDNGAWSDWLDKIGQDDWKKIADTWKVSIERRIVVTVKNGAQTVRGAKAELLNAAGEVIWSAVSDYEGKAYLFYLADAQNRDSDKPASVRVSAEGVEAVTVILGNEDEIEVQTAAVTTQAKLDLMFVVDTTGSMGDELEYLKAELGDVVRRVASESDVASIRTSVNFYRDEQDEYLVRYFGFKDDIDEAVRNISDQSANGGGDYEEAVHTALDNAINAHAWDNDSVKIMFLVLDAPPHCQADVIASLSASIEKAASMGIHIIPVMASGTDTTCEVLFRSIAILTGGTYAFLTNDSGVGNPHAEQSVGAFNVEKLNDLMVRVIKQYCA